MERRTRVLPSVTALVLATSAVLPSCAESAPGETYVYVLDEIRLLTSAQVVDGVSISDGFDLDGIEGPAPGNVCNDQSGADYTAPDGRVGIDNQFASEAVARVVGLLGEQGGGTGGTELVEGLVQNSVTSGSLLLLMRFDGVDSFENDEDVTMTVAFGAPFSVGVGTDGRLLAGQSFDTLPGTEPLVVDASIRDGVLRVGGIDLPLRGSIRELDFAIPMSLGEFRIEFNSNGTISGVLGGALPWQSIADIVPRFAPQYTAVANLVLRGIADITNDEGTGCDRLSMAMRVHGVRAHLFEQPPRDADAGVENTEP